jgi:hypothetical protein
MDFKSLLSQLDQLNEAKEKTKTGLKHTAEPGGYGRKDDEDEEGHKVKSTAAKKGKGRPKKDADDSGETKKYDFSAFGVKSGKDVKLPKHDKKKTTVVKGKSQSHAANKVDDGTDPGEESKTKKKGLKEYFDSLDKALNEAGYTTAPMPGAVAVKDATGKVVATAKNSQAAAAFQKGDITLGNPEQMKEEDIGKHNNATTGFDALVKKLTPKYGIEAAKRIAGAQLKKIREADQPPNDSLMSPMSEAKKDKKPDANKNGIPDYAEDGKGKNDLKKKKVEEAMDSESKTEKSKLPSMTHIKKMCKDGKTVAEICKMHPDCDHKELKQMVADCKKKMVKEGMEHKLKAARHMGKAHALTKESYNCKYDDMEEAKHYHEGYKEGLDECYGQMPIQGYVGETNNEVADMASYGAHTPTMEDELDEVSRGEYMKQKAKNTPGNTFKAFGQTFQDKEVLEDNPFFESFEKQLNSLLESEEVTEGMTVSISKGQQGSPDSVSVSAQDGEADQLLSIIKSAGLGLFGGDEQSASTSSHPMSVAVDSEAAPADIEVVDDHDDMLSLIRKMSGQAPAQAAGDYEEEGGKPTHSQHSHEEHEENCNECGMTYESCGCDSEPVDENENMYQREEEVAEDAAQDDGQAETTADENAEASEDQALATVDAAQNESEEELEESLANGADDTFESDIDFMTNVISGGLNKRKATGQSTIPVVSTQINRLGSPMRESTDLLTDWRKLSGIK